MKTRRHRWPKFDQTAAPGKRTVFPDQACLECGLRRTRVSGSNRKPGDGSWNYWKPETRYDGHGKFELHYLRGKLQHRLSDSPGPCEPQPPRIIEAQLPPKDPPLPPAEVGDHRDD